MKVAVKLMGLALPAIALLWVAGCTSRDSDDAMMAVAEPAALQAELKVAEAQRTRSRYLAYRHRVTTELPVDRVEAQYNRILDWCAADSEYRCTVLGSRLNTDNYVHGSISLRILPKGVAEALNLAAEGGETTRKSTEVEDLGDAIVDNQKRLEMLQDYRGKLEALSDRSDTDVESLVKIAEKLAEVQSDLEFAQGRRQKLLQRVEMDLVDISLVSQSQQSFMQPIRLSLRSFGSRLSSGISDVIAAIAYLLPWLLLLAVVLYILRRIWIRVRKR